MDALRQLLWEFFLENKLLFIGGLLFLFVVPLHEIVLPLLYGNIVTAINSGTNVMKPLVIVTCTLVALQFLDFWNDYTDTHLFPKLQAFIRSRIMTKLLNRYEDSIEELRTGEINTKIIKLPGTITQFIERCKNQIIPNMLLHLCAIGLFFYVDTIMGASMLITVFVLYFVLLRGPNKCEKPTLQRDSAFNDLHEEIDDNLRNLYSIYGTNQKTQEVKRIESYNQVYNERFRDTVLCSFKLRTFVSPVVITFIMILMYRTKTLVDSKKVKSSLLVPVLFITLYIINSFMSVDDLLKQNIMEWGIIKGSMDLLQTPPKKRKSKSKSNDNDDIPKTPGIGLKNVTFKYPGSDHYILNGVTLHINKGESVAILGDIGSGKSTILKLMLNYFEPTTGTVYYNGTSYDSLTVFSIRQKIGYVPQVPVLFNRTIMENILYGNTHVTREYVEKILDEMGLLKEFRKLKHGVDTRIGKNGSLLSGGQRQLVWCLRVMLSNPEVLILDEPTSSIDEQSKLLLRALLDRFMKNKTVIMVTHDPKITSFANKLVYVDKGKIARIQTKTDLYL
jgi:ABC-type multidrug transport system fused ATPase/permease subunit